MITVRFEIGEEEVFTFDKEFHSFNGRDLLYAIKKSRILKSAADIWYNDKHGIVYLGGRKPVGVFYVLPPINK